MLETVLSQFSSFNPFIFAIALLVGAAAMMWRPPTMITLMGGTKNRRRSHAFWRRTS